MSESAPSGKPKRGNRAATYRALLLAAAFFAAALILALLRGEPVDGRVLILYAGVGLFVGGIVTAISERRRTNGDTPAGDVGTTQKPVQTQTRDQLERRRRGQSITAVIGPVLFIALAAVAIWLFFDQETPHRAEAIVFVIIFVVAAILAPLWTLTARRATDRRIAELDQTS